MLCCSRCLGRTRAVASTQRAETLLNVLHLESDSKTTASLSNMFELVADDHLELNQNLKSKNPVLMSAAEQIFDAGGKRMRLALVFLVSRATAEIAGLKELTTEHRRFA